MQRSLSLGRIAHWLGRSSLIAAGVLPVFASAPPAAAQSVGATIFISNAAGGGALEGNDEVFTVTVSGTHPDTTISYGTIDDTALSGSDYVGVTTANVIVPSTASSAQIRIKTIQDNVFEPDESFSVGLRSTNYGTIIVDRGSGAIWNDDPLPALTVSNPSQLERDSGVSNMVFDVALTNPAAAGAIRVRYQTVDGAAIGGSDYQITTGVLTWLPGTNNTQQVMVPVRGDLVYEGDETFFLTFNSPSPLLQAPLPVGTATIVDDDGPTITLGNASTLEQDVGVHTVSLPVTLAFPTVDDVSFRFRTNNGTALGGPDFIPATGTLVTIPAGSTSGTVQVSIVGDRVVEPVETFSVELYDLLHAQPGSTIATVTILNDDH